ncbi:MAG TPA: Nif3-like dinuclear metal center hexameric protein [Kiritimatiellia bacterium]|nr:Nif3-like dinuclear metal center hexameric protein [Kiritimatiellia bacterium]HRU70326.1 Nif3-like dinuclear metal center hexameric protein [Kiritimatiellia bacterium]
MKTKLDDLVALLDGTLRCSAFQDVSNNGLQIANSGTVSRVVTGVDASLRLLQEAERRGADCVVCHHGLSWGDSLKRITGLNHRLVAFAIRHNIAVYAAHLPLDAHPRFGNNAQLCKALGLHRLSPAFCYHGETIGFSGEYAKPLTFEAFCERVRKAVTPDPRILNFGNNRVRRVGVVSGGASDMIDQAAALGCDVYLTGEPSLQGYNLAENLAQNVVFAGHYATEILGVRALATLITRRLGIPAACIDFKIGY